jgi:hypothetical protein
MAVTIGLAERDGESGRREDCEQRKSGKSVSHRLLLKRNLSHRF